MGNLVNARQEAGRRGEDAAADYLKAKGYQIIDRNVRFKLGELDLVALEGETLVFVEVKSGRRSGIFSPADHLDGRKRRKLLQLGRAYLARQREERRARFDLVTVVDDGDRLIVDHLTDVLQDSGP